jgi:hypothetical protein
MSALAPIATEMVRPRSRSRREWRDHIEVEAKKRTAKSSAITACFCPLQLGVAPTSLSSARNCAELCTGSAATSCRRAATIAAVIFQSATVIAVS